MGRWAGGVREGLGGVREVGGGEGEGGEVARCRRVTDTVFDRVQARLTLQHPGRTSPITTVFCSLDGGSSVRVPYTPHPTPPHPPPPSPILIVVHLFIRAFYGGFVLVRTRMMASSPPVIAAIYYPASVRPASRSSDFAGDDSHL